MNLVGPEHYENVRNAAIQPATMKLNFGDQPANYLDLKESDEGVHIVNVPGEVIPYFLKEQWKQRGLNTHTEAARLFEVTFVDEEPNLNFNFYPTLNSITKDSYMKYPLSKYIKYEDLMAAHNNNEFWTKECFPPEGSVCTLLVYITKFGKANFMPPGGLDQYEVLTDVKVTQGEETYVITIFSNRR